ncbi:N-acetylmuramoyl-L-alanine amidase [Streptomyces longwoodensis]|uniref:N-acetylmuramoyl-L-alanine amidase n=1 Tax=Streptomyces longwoodensis TaxID=68231 RepID=UPI0036E3D8E2
MATPMPADAFIAALKAEGLTVVEVGDWRHHNRNTKGPWGPVHGVMIHHTVTSGTARTVEICRAGHSELPGPLCHGVIAKSGVVYLVGYGRANHAGLGDPDVLSAIIDERQLPTDDQASVDGNRHFFGFECENLGDNVDPWPAEQLQAITRVAAAICRHYGWTERSVLRHLDWQPGKVDPRGPGMNWAQVQAAIAKRLGSKPAGTPAPRPQPLTVDLSKLIAAAKSDPGRAGTPVSYAGVRIWEAALVDEGLLAKTRLDGHFGLDTREATSRWQERLGYRGRQPGQPADGIPGLDSAKRLGAKHGFTIVA